MRRLSIAISSLAVLFCTTQSARADYIQTQRFEGDRISIDSQTGAQCSSRAADRANASLIGSARDNDSRVAALITIPFGGTKQGDCSELLKHEEARSRLELAAQLFEAGALEPQEFKAIAEDIASQIR